MSAQFEAMIRDDLEGPTLVLRFPHARTHARSNVRTSVAHDPPARKPVVGRRPAEGGALGSLLPDKTGPCRAAEIPARSQTGHANGIIALEWSRFAWRRLPTEMQPAAHLTPFAGFALSL